MSESKEWAGVQAVTLTNHPYGAAVAEKQGAVDFMRRKDEYLLFPFKGRAASRVQAWDIIAGEDSNNSYTHRPHTSKGFDFFTIGRENVKTFNYYTNHCINLMNINNTRSVYHQTVHKLHFMIDSQHSNCSLCKLDCCCFGHSGQVIVSPSL